MDEQRAWAKDRLFDLAERLTPNGAELAELRAANVADSRIEALYPFVFEEWEVGILNLTHDAEWAALPEEPHESLSCEQEVVHLLTQSWEDNIRPLSGELAKEWRTKQLAEAWASATDDRNPNLAPYILSFAVLLIEAIATDRAHPELDTFARQSWNARMQGFRGTVDQLVHLLQADDWQCASLRVKAKA